MSDDYLWDRSGPPDPDVERLEALLGRLRSTPTVPQLPASDRWTLHALPPMVAPAAVIALMIGATWRSTHGGASWEVARLAGRPRIGSTTVEDTGRLSAGQTLSTDGAARARVSIGTIGEVTIEPDSHMRL